MAADPAERAAEEVLALVEEVFVREVVEVLDLAPARRRAQ